MNSTSRSPDWALSLSLIAWSFVTLTPTLLRGDDPSTRNSDAQFELWDHTQPIPGSAELLPLADVQFHVIKRRVPEQDGYSWLHGVALAWHQDKLFASFGHNVGAENTAGEVANGCLSEDGGRSWGPLFEIDRGERPSLAVSHGVFLVQAGSLWAFQGAFTSRLQEVHTRAVRLNNDTGRWQRQGTVAADGFWPMQAPQLMDDGHWIMPGIAITNGLGGSDDPAAVAISHREDLTSWDVIKVPKPESMQMWGESALIVEGPKLTCIARFRRPIALVATSDDFGRSWTQIRESNLPMAASKPVAGVLSTGQRYLIGSIAADNGNRRSPLSIAVSQPGKPTLDRVFRIRDAIHEGPGESGSTVGLAYPYAIEHQGKLYVAYSNNGGRGGNRNSAELAIIPIASLR